MKSPEEIAKELLKAHGLVFKAVNPLEHHEPECGMCHHFDVLCLEAGIASAIKKVRKEMIGEAIKAIENYWHKYRNRVKSFGSNGILIRNHYDSIIKELKRMK